jgi:peptidoglycan/LPS O-acetylase OafA/YrhL
MMSHHQQAGGVMSMSTKSQRVPAKAATPPSHRRLDIQGLRALAVILVALNHADVPGLAGGYIGVDVFFVISGFVITQSMLGPDNHRGISLSGFYAARARRILPMATLVTATTLFASWLLLNYVRAEQVSVDAFWSTIFLANFHFAGQGTDYFSADTPPSPLQHFWSLAVEEQFYLVWPILLGVLIFGITRKARPTKHSHETPRYRILAALAIIIVASFVWSIVQTAEEPTAAYFSPLTRTWELAAGAVLAVASPYIKKIPAAHRVIASWVGLAGIVLTAFVFTESTPFPGYAVALPILSTVLVIGGGTAIRAGGADSVLSWKPLQRLGDWSFSIYLWHWPALVIVAGYLGRELTVLEGLGIVALSVGLSYLTWRWVEEPFRTSEWFKAEKSNSLALWPAALAVALCSILAVTQSLQAGELQRTSAAAAAAPAPVPISQEEVLPGETAVDAGAEAVKSSVLAARANAPIPVALTPAIDLIDADIFEMPGCTAGDGETSSEICPQGDTDASDTIVIIGDSHAEHWIPSLDQIGDELGIKVVPIIKHGCTSVDVTVMLSNGSPFTECNEWRAWAIAQALETGAATTIVSSTIAGSIQNEAGEALTDGRIKEIATLWSAGVVSTTTQLGANGSRVVMLSDAPGVSEVPTECLLRRDATLATCTWPQVQRTEILNEASGAGAAASGIEFVDLTNWFCFDGDCPLVIGNTVAYRDTNHITITFGKQMAAQLAAKLGLTA